MFIEHAPKASSSVPGLLLPPGLQVAGSGGHHVAALASLCPLVPEVEVIQGHRVYFEV